MAKKNNAPAQAGATPKELEQKPAEEVQVVETQSEEVQVEEVQLEETQSEEVQVEEIQEEEVKVSEAEVIASNVFIAEDGTELTFAVQHFICPNGQRYTVEEAIATAPEVLEVLYKANSFIFKK